MKKICFFLLLCFVFIIKTTAQTLPFENEIKAFEAKDAANPPMTGQIMLYGSSTIRFWTSCEADFANKNLKVVNRGFGGSVTSEANEYFDRVVMPHKPKYIFFYEGDNDINAGKSVETVWADFKIFMQKVKTQLPNTRVVYFAIKPCPSRIQHFEKEKVFNKLVKKMARKDKNLYYMDTFNIMLGSDGKPMAKLFKQDMLHMNADGYALWTIKVQKLLKKWEK